jgi:signal transduction histidine kinase
MMPEYLNNCGLIEAIERIIQQYELTPVKISFQYEQFEKHSDPLTTHVLYRIVQEAISNSMKHSGCKHLDISISSDNAGMDILIEDDGKGFDLPLTSSDGVGINNIKNRVQYLGGTVQWDSSAERGTLLSIYIPV